MRRCEGTGSVRCTVVLSLVLGLGSSGDASSGAPTPRVCMCSSASAGGGHGGAGSREAQWHGLWGVPAAVVQSTLMNLFYFSHSDIYGVVFYCALNLHFPHD